jgi:hypothetical protein
MRHPARQTRENRTLPVDFHNAATYSQLLGDGKACIDCVLACLFALGLQRKHNATCGGGGGLTRHAHSVRVPSARGHPRAAPVPHVSCWVHRPAPLRLALAPEAA